MDVDQSGGQLRLEDTDALFNANDSSKSGSKKSNSRKELDAAGIANRVFADLYPETDPEWDPDLLFELLFINDDYYEQAVNRGILDFIRAWRS